MKMTNETIQREILNAANAKVTMSLIELDLNRPYSPVSFFVVCYDMKRREFNQVEYDDDRAYYTTSLQDAADLFNLVCATCDMTVDEYDPYGDEIDAREDANDHQFDFQFCPANHYPALI